MVQIHRKIESDYFKLTIANDNFNKKELIFNSETIKRNSNIQCSINLDYKFRIDHEYTEPFADLRGTISPLFSYLVQKNITMETLPSTENRNIIESAFIKVVQGVNSVSNWVTSAITGEEIKEGQTSLNPYSWYFPYMWTGTNYPTFIAKINLEALKDIKDLRNLVNIFNKYLRLRGRGGVFPNFIVEFGNTQSSWIKAGGNRGFRGVVCRLMSYSIKGNKENVIDNYPTNQTITLNFEVMMPFYNNSEESIETDTVEEDTPDIPDIPGMGNWQ